MIRLERFFHYAGSGVIQLFSIYTYFYEYFSSIFSLFFYIHAKSHSFIRPIIYFTSLICLFDIFEKIHF